MQEQRRIWAFAILAIVNGGVIACVGGGGGLSGPLETWDSPPPSTERSLTSRETAPGFFERAQLSTESPSRSPEPAPGAQGKGAPGTPGTSTLDCSGTYLCREVGKTNTDTVTLTQTLGGACVVDGTSIEPDGRLTSKGKTVGTWSVTSTGFTATANGETIICTKSDVGQAGSPSTPPATTGAATPPSTSRDAG